MRKSPIVIIAMVINVIGLGVMIIALVSMLGYGYEDIIFFGATGILGCAQVAGALLMLFGKKRMDLSTWRHLKIYWVLAIVDLGFMGFLCNWGDEEIVPSLIIGLVLSMYHLYINVSAINVVTGESNI